MGNILIGLLIILGVGAIVHKLWKNYKNSASCSIACTSCPLVERCSKDSVAIKQELKQEIRLHS
ncbi:MAG: FeoB-associated Cys-rich membrane protein [Bacillota bacterium]